LLSIDDVYSEVVTPPPNESHPQRGAVFEPDEVPPPYQRVVDLENAVYDTAV